MKLVFASTPDQEEMIKELVEHFYHEVFPLYFSDQTIRQFEKLKILHMSLNQFESFDTLGEAYQVITSLQTLISILQTTHQGYKYEDMFNHNVSILQEFGLYFPFDYAQFIEAKSVKSDEFSVYIKAANEFLV